MNIDGMKELDRKLDSLANVDIKEAVGKAIDYVHQCAIGNVHSHQSTGELENRTFYHVVKEGDTVIGICQSNSIQGMYVEFGTGPKGQENHSGISPDVTPGYTQTPWWIHESQVDAGIAEKYHWFHIDTPEGRFYQCTGQPADPWLYPALKDNQDTILKDMEADFISSIEKAVK